MYVSMNACMDSYMYVGKVYVYVGMNACMKIHVYVWYVRRSSMLECLYDQLTRLYMLRMFKYDYDGYELIYVIHVANINLRIGNICIYG